MLKIVYILSLLVKIISSINLLRTNAQITNPICTTLSNENIFLIKESGVYVYDKDLKNIVKNSFEFSEENLTKDNLPKVKLSKLGGKALICIIKDNIYLFDNEGNFLLNHPITLYLVDGKSELYTLFGLGTSRENDYIYYVGCPVDDGLYFDYFIYDPNGNSFMLRAYNSVNDEGTYKGCLHKSNCNYNIRNDLLNCHLMTNSNGQEIIACFYIVQDENLKEYFEISHFILKTSFIERSNPFYSTSNELSNVSAMKSVLSPDGTKAFICVIFNSGESKCFIYDSKNSYTDGFDFNFYECTKNICQTKDYSLKVDYFSEKEEYIFGCIGEDSNITTCIFDKNFNFLEFNTNFECGNGVDTYSYIYSEQTDDYYIILGESCEQKVVIHTTYLEEKIEVKSTLIKVTEKLEDKVETQKEVEERCLLKKCKLCDDQSFKKSLCLKCNEEEGYYPLKNYNPYQDEEGNYIDCFSEDSKPYNYYFNREEKYFERCYKSCETCEKGGDDFYNNCTTCKVGYERDIKTSNCEIKCDKYYYIYFGEKFCTKEYMCPENYPFLIKETGKCSDNCDNEEIYKLVYDDECVKECPNNTNLIGNICKDNDECILTKKKLILPNGNITDDIIEKLEKNYAIEFNYTENHLILFENEKYSILFYKNEKCIDNLSLEFSQISFDACYSKVQRKNLIEDKLIIGLVYININNKINKNNPLLDSIEMYDPNKGNRLNISDNCQNESIIIQENLINKLSQDDNPEIISQLLKQNIDVFNPKDNFYSDICYKFDSPNNKDISLKDRLLIIYPNITLCQRNCELKGVNPDSMETNCECKFNEILNNNLLSNNMWYQDKIEEISQVFSGTNLVVLKCFKQFFKYKYYINGYGPFINLFIIFTQIILTIFHYQKSVYYVRKYVFDITDKYSSYLIRLKKINSPNKKHLRKVNQIKNKENYISSETRENNKGQGKKNNNIFTFNNINNINNNYTANLEKTDSHKNLLISKNETKIMNSKSNNLPKNNFNLIENLNHRMEKYILTDFDDLDYEDALIRDNMKFSEYLWSKVKINLSIFDIFFNENKLRPMTIKILLMVLNLNINLIINALYFSDDLISEIFNSKNDNKYSYIIRTFNRIFYIILSIFAYYNVIDCFFINENKIKGIFKRKKDNIHSMKIEVYQVLKLALKRFTYFIIFSFFISIFSFYYISCFNNIYPNTQVEWLKSSILNIFVISVVLIVLILLESILRYLALYAKSEILYKLSIFLSEIYN